MIVTVKLFGMLKTQLHNESELKVPLDQGCRVYDLIAAIQSMNADVGDLLLKRKILVSVNHEVADGETELAGTDEIALLPPFSGGACPPWEMLADVYR
ncbi:MAG: MoaD/ThiS family protein [Nitrospira sp. SB0666_bin_27]|nr:MoaD/ThiS family protein [Nitrospira sp. SB0666_bin_27]